MYRMVFTQNFCRVIIFTVAVVISSCSSYRVFEIETLQPAKITLEKSKRIGLLDRKIRVKDSPVVFTDTVTEASLWQQFANGINYILSEAGQDTVIPIVTKKKILINNVGYPESLSDKEVKQYCDDWQTDYLVSVELEYYSFQHYILICNRLIRIYQSGNPAPLESFMLSDTLPAVDYDDSDVLFSELNVTSWDQGAECGQQIVPFWKKSERRVYAREKTLRVGDVFWQNNEKEQAFKIWQGATKRNDKLALKASINLAWYYEDAGDFDSAIRCLTTAEELVKKSGIHNGVTAYLDKYKRLIKQRISEKEKLDRQLLSD